MGSEHSIPLAEAAHTHNAEVMSEIGFGPAASQVLASVRAPDL